MKLLEALSCVWKYEIFRYSELYIFTTNFQSFEDCQEFCVNFDKKNYIFSKVRQTHGC